MRKKLSTLMSLLLLLGFAAPKEAQASCVERYQKDIKELPWIKGEDGRYQSIVTFIAGGSVLGSGVGGLAGFYTGAGVTSMAASGLIAGPIAAVGATVGIVKLSNIKEKKMIKLIEQSKKFAQEKENPGRLLKKLHKKFEKHVDSNVTMEQVARMVVDGDMDGSLCGTDNKSFHQIKKNVKNGLISLDMNEEEILSSVASVNESSRSVEKEANRRFGEDLNSSIGSQAFGH